MSRSSFIRWARVVVVAAFCCCERQRWFSSERISGYGLATNASSAIASSTPKADLIRLVMSAEPTTWGELKTGAPTWAEFKKQEQDGQKQQDGAAVGGWRVAFSFALQGEWSETAMAHAAGAATDLSEGWLSAPVAHME